MDVLTPEQRKFCMSRIRAKNTKPELIVRSLAHRNGYRYRLHRKDLPGCPDLVFVSLRRVIFVHGCFWHQHKNCKYAKLPKTRAMFWAKKLENNRKRDATVIRKLAALGWRVLVIWECQTRSIIMLEAFLGAFMNTGYPKIGIMNGSIPPDAG